MQVSTSWHRIWQILAVQMRLAATAIACRVGPGCAKALCRQSHGVLAGAGN